MEKRRVCLGKEEEEEEEAIPTPCIHTSQALSLTPQAEWIGGVCV
jgi:hypothetical protein